MNPGKRGRTEAAFICSLSFILLVTAWFKWLPLDFTEALGFATGAICVWMVTRENIWNWPIGITNNILFAILFWESRLYADLGLQGIYLLMGVYGWWKWLRGGEKNAPLQVSSISKRNWITLLVLIPSGTWIIRQLLLAVNGSAPFLDALTTVLCLAAQYLLCLKKLENWYLWILADIIYVPLYLSKKLPLTALLYAGFIFLCILGYKKWRKELPS